MNDPGLRTVPLNPQAPGSTGHRGYEDLQALLTGSLVAAFGIVLLNEAGLLTGGTVGLALLLIAQAREGWEREFEEIMRREIELLALAATEAERERDE